MDPSRGVRLTWCVLLSAGGYAALGRWNSANGLTAVLQFLAVIAGLFALAALARPCLDASRYPAVWIFSSAVLFRLLILPAGLPDPLLPSLAADLQGRHTAFDRFLLYDHDVWRYLWDGHVAASGASPFAHPPLAPELDPLADSGLWRDIRDNVNYPEIRTLYPPAAQAVFRLAHLLAPGSVLALKLILTAFDLAAGVLLWLTLRREPGRANDVIWYVWNPLVIKVFAGSAHVDSLAVMALAAMLWLARRERPLLAACALGVAISAKLSPLILLPAAWRFLGWRAAVLAACVAALSVAPYVREPHLFDGVRTFSLSWRFNAGVFSLAELLLGPAAARAGMLAAVAGMSIVSTRSRDLASASGVALGSLLLLSPAVMPWYVPWLLPGAVIARQWAWVSFSFLVFAAFAVMIDQRERPWVLAVEYGALIGLLAIGRKWIMRLRFLVTAALAASPALFAQGSGSTAPAPPAGAGVPERPFQVTKTSTGVLTSIRDGIVTLDDEKLREPRKLNVAVQDSIHVTADKRSELAGRKKLSLADLKAGMYVKITYLPETKSILEIRVLKPKAS